MFEQSCSDGSLATPLLSSSLAGGGAHNGGSSLRGGQQAQRGQGTDAAAAAAPAYQQQQQQLRLPLLPPMVERRYRAQFAALPKGAHGAAEVADVRELIGLTEAKHCPTAEAVDHVLHLVAGSATHLTCDQFVQAAYLLEAWQRGTPLPDRLPPGPLPPRGEPYDAWLNKQVVRFEDEVGYGAWREKEKHVTEAAAGALGVVASILAGALLLALLTPPDPITRQPTEVQGYCAQWAAATATAPPQPAPHTMTEPAAGSTSNPSSSPSSTAGPLLGLALGGCAVLQSAFVVQCYLAFCCSLLSITIMALWFFTEHEHLLAAALARDARHPWVQRLMRWLAEAAFGLSSALIFAAVVLTLGCVMVYAPLAYSRGAAIPAALLTTAIMLAILVCVAALLHAAWVRPTALHVRNEKRRAASADASWPWPTGGAENAPRLGMPGQQGGAPRPSLALCD